MNHNINHILKRGSTQNSNDLGSAVLAQGRDKSAHITTKDFNNNPQPPHYMDIC